MATRQERLLMRMRGANAHEVGDLDFDFVIPDGEDLGGFPVAGDDVDGDEQLPDVEPIPSEPAPAPPTRPTPNTSVKRKRINRNESQTRSPPPPAAATTLPPPPAPMDIDSPEDPSSTPRPSTVFRSRTRAAQQNSDFDMRDAPPTTNLSSVVAATRRLTVQGTSPPPPIQELVMESPADAPGSGRRQRLVDMSEALTPVAGSSAFLQRVLRELDETVEDVETSSPIERRVATRRSLGARSRASTNSRASGAGVLEPVGEDQELPDAPSSAGSERRRSQRLSGSSSMVGQQSSPVVHSTVRKRRTRLSGSSVIQEEVEEEDEAVSALPGQEDDSRELDGEEPTEDPEPEPEPEPEEAEEIGEKEAARRLGRKRPRERVPSVSPELDSRTESPAVKRRRRRGPASPAVQQQPKKAKRGRNPSSSSQPPKPPTKLQQSQPSPEPPALPEPKTKPKKQPSKRRRRAATEEEQEEGETAGAVGITVQRFTKPPQVETGDGDNDAESDLDITIGDIPFANRTGVNAVDVLSKLCEELAEAMAAKLRERGVAAEDAASRREIRTMLRALDAFQEELRTRLLEHTIALDTLHSVRKRVRAAQKERLALRDEIMRIRAERDQVALRIDALRINYEVESKEALRHNSLSTAMHDIDLAVETGRAAPELSPREQKKADLANLELLISRVADQACSRSDGGGALRQIKEFNAFLERAATVLEGR